MRSIVLYLLLVANLSVQGQLFNNGADFHVDYNAIVVVKGTDFINNGQVTHKGYLLVDNNITNDKDWTCNDLDSSTVELGLHWTNNDSFESGAGAVNFIGNDQNITGLSSSVFYTLNLFGNPLDVKSMGNDIEVNKRLNLFNAELASNSSTALMNLSSDQITRVNGFVSTLFDGRLNRDLNPSTQTNTFPLGHNKNGKVIYRPIVTNNTNSGTYRTAFIYEDASNYGMNTNSLQDSLCTVNDEYFHIVGSSPSDRGDFAIVTDRNEQWTKLADWKNQWKKITPSGETTVNNQIAYEAQNYLSGNDRAIVLATERPFVDIESLVYVPFKSSYTFEPDYYAPGNSTYSWTPPDYLDCDYCPNPVYTAGLPETYIIEVDNNTGCIAVDTIQIIVVRGEDNPILVPNAFTPNGDNLNEIFRPYLYSFEELISLAIYNRWGEKIYEGLDGWDGTYRGNIVPMGAYVFIAEIREIKAGGFYRRNHISGTVTIVK
jgi:gliding motility-associated-like protein